MLRNYYFILETVVGFVLLLVLNTLLFNTAPAYAGAHPHPYWIVILLVASRYGTLQGLFAGITAAFFYIFLNSNSDIFSNSIFPYGGYVLPFLFVLVGGVIGEQVKGAPGRVRQDGTQFGVLRCVHRRAGVQRPAVGGDDEPLVDKVLA